MAFFMLIAYPILKLALYTYFCRWSLKYFNSPDRTRQKAFSLGFIRFLIGVTLGLVIPLAFLESKFGSNMGTFIFSYIIVYSIVRWLEWSIIYLMIPKSIDEDIQYVSSKVFVWIFLGILVSFFVDAVFAIVIDALPGRLIC